MARRLAVPISTDLTDFERGLLKVAKKIDRFAKDITSLGVSLAKSVTAPLAALGTASVLASESIDKAMDTIRIGTGATGTDLDALGKSFSTVFTSVPASAQMAATAIADVNTRLGLTGPALEAMSTQMMNLARKSGTEVRPMIQSTTQALLSWGVAASEQSGALDQLWKVGQATGISVMDLSRQLQVGGAAMRATGMSFLDAASMMGMLHQQGVPAEAIISGLTQGAGRLAAKGIDMATGMRQAIEAIRQAPTATAAATVAVATFGEAGVRLADAIRRGGMDVEGFVAKIQASPETINKAAKDTDSFAEALVGLKNKLTDALGPLGKRITAILVDSVIPAMEWLVAKLKDGTTWFQSLSPEIQTAIVAFGGIVASAAPALLAMVGLAATVSALTAGYVTAKVAIFSAGTALWGWVTATAAAGGATGAFIGILATVVSGVGAVAGAFLAFGRVILGLTGGPIGAMLLLLPLVIMKWDWLREKLFGIIDKISVYAKQMWSELKLAAAAIWGSIKSTVTSTLDAAWTAVKQLAARVIASAADLALQTWETLQSGLDVVFDWLVEQWDSLGSLAQRAVSRIIGLWDAAKARVAGVVGWMLGAIKSVISALSKIGGSGLSSSGSPTRAPAGPPAVSAPSAPSPAPVFGSLPNATLSSPTPVPITALADGGIVNRPTLALIGERGPEAVIPLSRGGSRGGSGGIIVQVTVRGSVATQRDLADQIRRELIRAGGRNGSTGIV